MTQLDLFSSRPAPLPAHQRNSPTSVASAGALQPIVGRIDQQTLDAIRHARRRGTTNYELVETTGIALQTICGAVRRLFKKGLIVYSSESRPSPSGRGATVRVAVEYFRNDDGDSAA